MKTTTGRQPAGRGCALFLSAALPLLARGALAGEVIDGEVSRASRDKA